MRNKLCLFLCHFIIFFIFINITVTADSTWQPETTVGLFRLVPGTSEAVRVPVQLGRASVSTIEVRGGLAEGDRVILSDTSAWDAYDRIRLE